MDLPKDVNKTKILYLPAKSIPFVGLDGRGVVLPSQTTHRPGWSPTPGSALYAPDPNDGQWQAPRDSELNAHPIHGYLFHRVDDQPTEHLRRGYHLRLAHVLANIMAPLSSPTGVELPPSRSHGANRAPRIVGVPAVYIRMALALGGTICCRPSALRFPCNGGGATTCEQQRQPGRSPGR